MKFKTLLAVLSLFPLTLFAAERTDVSVRTGVARISMTAQRAPSTVTGILAPAPAAAAPASTATATATAASATTPIATAVDAAPDNCRDAYRDCMNEFCLMDESEGERCACSSNIDQSKSIIQEIQKIQTDAENMFTTDVERERLGAKAKLVFGESEAAKKSSRVSGLSLSQWLNNSGGDESLGTDAEIGDDLYYMAAGFCADKLKACGDSAEMEESLYSRLIVQDCKDFNTYLETQKKDAEANKKIAEAAVRQARFEMLDTTNKYNRGECLLAYKSCIADKGGCGVNFENCLDAELLGRRANACENVLDQCMAVKTYVVEDWAAESKTVLADAEKYADKNRRATCEAKIWACLEDSCSTATNTTCLTNVNVAAGICPIIDECDEIIPGLKQSTNTKLTDFRNKFCQNDVDKCFQDKCGKNYNAPECMGKTSAQIKALCPQSSFISCKGEPKASFDIIVQSVFLEMDYQKLTGCVNYFGEELGKVCGTDMACLPANSVVNAITELPKTEKEKTDLENRVRESSKTAVAEFFTRFEKDITVAACMDAKKPTGRGKLGDTVFNTAKLVADVGAENRALRELDTKLAELLKTQRIGNAADTCYTLYQTETPEEGKKNYSYVSSVNFEPALCNCHVCRKQQVCETGGESKGSSGLKSAAGMGVAGASAGTMVAPGWGTAIGGAVGLIGGFAAGFMGSEGKQEFCQEIESCEDINVGLSCN